jgi:cellulose biosynthesis protein BcsQ
MEVSETLKKKFDMLTIEKHSKSICISNYKGGLGKTTITTLGYYLASLKKPVLLFDIDPQCSLSLAVGFDPVKVSSTRAADESFFGGKNKNRHADKKILESRGLSEKDKTPVLSLMQTGGNVHLSVVSDTKATNLKPIIEKRW